MGKISKMCRDEKSPLRKPAVGKNGKKSISNTASSHRINMANKVRAKYQRLSVVTTAVACSNLKRVGPSTATALSAIITINDRTPIGACPAIHDADMDELAAMFSKLSISCGENNVNDINKESSLSINVNPLPVYGSRQIIDVIAHEQIGNVLQQIRLEMAVSQQLSQSLGSASLSGSSRRRKRSACDDDDVGDDSVVLSDEEYFAKRRKFSNKERNFA